VGSTEADLRAAGDRIEALLDGLRVAGGGRVWQQAEELVRLVTELYGAGLARVLDAATAGAPDGGAALVERLAADDLVASLLVLHGLHPLDLTARVEQALEEVRPYAHSHGGDLELLGIDEEEGVAFLRMVGTCDGCPSSSVTLEHAVEKAVAEVAPEIVRLEVEGAVAEPPAGVELSAPRRSGEVFVALTTKPEVART